MPSMINLKSFTRVLVVFCLIVFTYTVIPQVHSQISEILKYIIIIMIIIILMIYNQILSNLTIPNSKNLDKPGLSSKISSDHTSDIKDLYNNLTSLIVSTTKSINQNCKSAIFIIDPIQNSFVLQSRETNEFADSISASNSTLKKYIKNNKKLHQKDHPTLWNNLFYLQSWRGSECAIFSPIILKNRSAGFILSRIDHFTDMRENELNILNHLGQFVSFSLENLSDLETHIIGEDSKSLVLDILSNLDFKSDSQNIYNKFKFLILTMFDYDRLTISIRKETENRREYDKGLNLIVILTAGDKDQFTEGIDFPTNGSLHGLPVINGASINTMNWQKAYSNMVRFKSTESDEQIYQSVLGSPIIIDNESKGSIVLERKSENAFSSIDLKNLELIGQVLGSALNWKNEYEKIHINATHDGLSGLLNHQTFKERFNDEIQRAERFQQKMAIMIFDLDKFKKVNDTLGHQYGDYVIQTVSKIMEDNVRAVDVVARYGGEEFAVILINTTAVMSNVVAQRIVSNIAEYPFSMNGVDTNITISGGMSEYPSHSNQMSSLIEFADQAMYSTKQNGGNGITIHNEKLAENDGQI